MSEENQTVKIELALLKDCLGFLEDTQDEGPMGEGWKSDELMQIIGTLESIIEESECKKS